jgi:hypothetical protein
VAVELEEVVGGGDQAPPGPDGGSAASVEAVDAAVVFGVGKDRLDELLATSVEAGSQLGAQDLAHEAVEAAVPAGPVALAFADGRLDWREWNAQDGTTRQALQIIAETVQFLGPAAPNTIATDYRDLAPRTAGSSDDDIPF